MEERSVFQSSLGNLSQQFWKSRVSCCLVEQNPLEKKGGEPCPSSQRRRPAEGATQVADMVGSPRC